jgi:drug/metabolite transporter (DMT)-like permease
MAEGAPDYRTLVRRDLMMVGAGVVAALLAAGVLVAAKLDVIGDKPAATIVVVIAIIVAVACVASWLAGPDELRRDRYILGVPVFLVAGPALFAFSSLGGGSAVVVVSSAIAFSAAIAAGLALASRRS